MDIMTKIAIIGLSVTILLNIIAIVAFLQRQKDNIEFLQKTFNESKLNVISSVNEYRERTEKIIEDIKHDAREHKYYVTKLFDDFKITVKEDMARLEAKQDKHNDVISRTYKLEKDIEKAHMRIDFIETNKN